MGNIVQLRTRRLYHVIETRESWDARLSLVKYPEAVKELFFWKNNFHLYNYRKLSTQYVPCCQGFSDGSSTGLAAHISIDGAENVIYKNWSAGDAAKSSTWRELFAIFFSIISLKDIVSNRAVQWHTDNYAASLIFKSGSNKEELQNLSEEIFEICKNSNIFMSVKWVPREYIPRADAISRKVDYDDWETTTNFFQYLNELWGPFTIDRFANSKNAKLPRFNSKYLCPATEGVDAFTFSWKFDNNFMVPLVYLVEKTIKHLSY